ncbi:hypothetical protein IFR04_014204 [Cadophora malorum]|uniref:Nucleoplasmin-like domain-containing protein n=1 Tax=Cadophora malorum TaxID=108018 RepID=A0A8H7W541_9HELO|nr:hypothetical protein IFR04_014204 [Cadophora malorum]
MSLPENNHIFCCSSAKISEVSISFTPTGSKLLDFAMTALDGKLPCRPKFAFEMEDEDVGDFIFSVITTEPKIAHSSTEHFCNFHVTGPDADPSILVIKVQKVVLREEFELDADSEIRLECKEHKGVFTQARVLKRLPDQEKDELESASDQLSDPVSDPRNNNKSDPGHISGPESGELSEQDSAQVAKSDEGPYRGLERGRKLVREWL